MKYIFVTLIVFLSLINPLAAQEVSIDATVDKNEVYLDDTFTLSVTLRGGPDTDMDNITIPSLNDFNIVTSYSSQSTNFSITSTTTVETVKSIQYILSPVKTGDLVIGPFEVNTGGKSIKSNSIKIKVLNTGKSPPPSIFSGTPREDMPEYSGEKDFFVTQSVDKEDAYVNEQVTLTFKFYYRIELFEAPQYQAPPVTGFIVRKLSQSSTPVIEDVEGVKFYVETIKTALFPMGSGDKTIGSSLLNVPIDFLNYKTLKTDEINVHVKPLPKEGRPENFSGAVGEYTIYIKGDKEKTEINQPVTLELTVEGWGNADTIGQPEIPSIPGCKIYPSGNSENTSEKDNIIYSKKVFKYVFMPGKSGNFEFPEISYSYFNPSRNKYETVKTKKLEISVLPGDNSLSPVPENTQQDIKITGHDINYIKTSMPKFNKDNLLYKRGIFVPILVFPIVVLLISLFYKKHSDRLNSDVKFARTRRAYRRSRAFIDKARKSMNNKDGEEEFYSLLDKALREYLGDKLNLAPPSIALEQMMALLEEKQAGKDVIDLFRKCYESCEFARFAPGKAMEKMEENINMMEKLLNLLEKVRF